MTFLLWLWDGTKPYPFYNEARISAIAHQINDHVRTPHRIVLLTNRPIDVPAGVDEIRPCPPEIMYPDTALRSPVNCTRRLRVFDPQFSEQFGTDWIAPIDIDTLILDDITDIVDRAMLEPGGITLTRGRETDIERTLRPYNGAFWIMRVGAHPQVWIDWDATTSPQLMQASGWLGSDQVWLSIKIKGAATMGPEHGVYYLGQYEKLTDADTEPRIINFAGRCKPWSKPAMKRCPELYDYYRDYDPQAPKRT